MAKKLLMVALATAVVLAPVVGAAGPRTKLRWTQREPMVQARTEAAFAQTKNQLYVVGGFAPSLLNTPTVEIYNARKDAWQAGPPFR